MGIHLHGVQGVECSNHSVPTIIFNELAQSFQVGLFHVWDFFGTSFDFPLQDRQHRATRVRCRAFFDANLPTLPLTFSSTFLVVVDEFIEQCFQ